MFKTSLFVSFPLTPAFEKCLKTANPKLVALFTQGGDEYLEPLEHRGQHFLGKALGETSDLARVALVEANISSLLRRLVPDFPYQDVPMVIVAKRQTT